MEWTNSVPIFQDDITFILQPEILHHILSLINNVGTEGPKDWKIVNSSPTKHSTNSNICLALWEFFELLNCIFQQMKYCDRMFSGHKLVMSSKQNHHSIDTRPHSMLLDHLQKNVLSTCCLAAIYLEAEHAAMIYNYNFQASNLILMRNTRIEVTHHKKMRPCYLGPLVVISCNCGSTYILCKLDGPVLHHPVAAFCLIPYFTREHISVPSNTFDIDTSQLCELEQTDLVDDDDTGDDASEEN
ncbi:hypothetical protein J132_01595 [Termitomyces sp. J132]|nr:hypothetical protein J132_01595 [Termitomyces sp. J132]